MWKPELMCIQFEDIKVDRLLIAELQEMEKGGKSLRRRAAEKKSEREEKREEEKEFEGGARRREFVLALQKTTLRV